MERLQLFWANHFTVSLAKGSARGLVGAFERDAIRPNLNGSFEALLKAATTHPAMLRYLDNSQSAGPHSPVVARERRRAARIGEPARVTGINENLAREVLELHTLGAASGARGRADGAGYTQADVTAFAAVLTGWRVGQDAADAASPFDRRLARAGAEDRARQALSGRSRRARRGAARPGRPSGDRALRRDQAGAPLRRRRAAAGAGRTAAAAFLQSSGDLPTVYRALVRSPEAWAAEQRKLKTPAEFVVSSVRLLGLGERLFERGDGLGVGALGQRLLAAPSPAGWSDRADDWLGPDAVWKRVEWSTRTADRVGRLVDARALAARSLGPLLDAATRQQIERAADGPQALALLLMAPEFQRR